MSVIRLDAPLVYNGVEVRRNDEFLNLTDMWRAAGGSDAQRPAQWARRDGADFIAFVQDNLNVSQCHIEAIRTVRGGTNPGTWAHWQIAFAYAKYLSHPFHVWCNDVVRARIEGRDVHSDHPTKALYDRILRHKENKANWEMMWRREVVGSIAPLYGKPEPRGQFPLWMCKLIEKLYNELFGKEIMNEARARRGPHTGKGNLLTQYMQDDAKEFLRTHIDVVLALAKTSSSPDDFWSKISAVFGKSMLQLPIFAMDGVCCACGESLEVNHRFCPTCGTKAA